MSIFVMQGMRVLRRRTEYPETLGIFMFGGEERGERNVEGWSRDELGCRVHAEQRVGLNFNLAN